MPGDRKQRTRRLLAVAIIGGTTLCVVGMFAIFGQVRPKPDIARAIASAVIVALAMGWACFFTVRAHYAQDEFNRQREITASFWGGWLGIAASAPVYVLLALDGLPGVVNIAHSTTPPLIVLTLGYMLPVFCAAIGAIGGRIWLRRRDKSAVPA